MIVEPQRVHLAPGYTISCLLKGGWQLAGGHGEVDAADALADMDGFVEAGITTFDCADIYSGVEALIGEWLKRRRRAGDVGPCKCTPSTCPTSIGCRRIRVPTSRAASIARWPASAWTASTSCNFTGGITACRVRGGGRLARRASPCGQDSRLGLTNFDRQRLERDHRGRHPHRLAPGAVFGARPAPGRRDGGALRRNTASACSVTARSRAGFCPTIT